MPRRIPTILSGGASAGGGGASAGGGDAAFQKAPPATLDAWTIWLATAERQAALVEIEHPYEVESAGPTYSISESGMLYLSNVPYATESTDTPANISYADVLLTLPTWSSSLPEELPMGGAFLSYGSIEVDNTDQRSNHLLQIPLQGRKVSVYLGDAYWPRASFRLALTARVELVEATSTDRISIRLTSASMILNRRVPMTTIGGSGENASRYKPILWGRCHNILLVSAADSTNLRYWLNDGSGATIVDVRDRGVSLISGYPSASGTNAVITADAGTDAITISGHGFQNNQVVTVTSSGSVFAGLTAGSQYWVVNVSGSTLKLSATRGGSPVDITGTTFTGTMNIIARGFRDNNDGSIDLSATPVGPVTADAYTSVPDRGFYSSSSGNDGIIEYAIDEAGLNSGDIVAYHVRLDGANTIKNPPLGYYLTEPVNLLDLIHEVVISAGNSFWAERYDGRVLLGSVVWSRNVSASPDWTLVDDDLVARDALSLRTTSKSYAFARFVYNRNWYVQREGEFASGVSEENRAKWSKQGPVGPAGVVVTYANQWLSAPYLYYEGAEDSEPQNIDSLISESDPEDARTTVNGQQTSYWLRRPPDVLEAQVSLAFYDVELGDVCTCTFTGEPLGVNAGSYWILVGKTVDFSNNRVVLKLVRLHYWATPQTSQYYG